MYVGAFFNSGNTARHLRLKRRRAIYLRIPARFDAADTAACFDSIYKNVFTQHSDNRISFTDIRITKDQVSFLCDRPSAQSEQNIPVAVLQNGSPLLIA